MALTPWPGSGIGGLGSMLGGYEPEPAKKFTSSECLEGLMKYIDENPDVVRNHIKIFTSQASEEMRDVLWPAIFDDAAWDRTATHRPTHDDEGEKLLHSDRTVREYENTVWDQAGRTLEATVTTEHGEMTFNVVVKWT
jgi:hypothetical protein